MEDADDEVGDPEGERVGAERERVGAERVRDRERRDEHRAHRREHGEPDDALLGIDRVREPGVCGPGPPERGEHRHPSGEASPGRIVGEKRRDLREREHEHEVEEELEDGDALLALLLGRHRHFRRTMDPGGA
jgi:hypothetical protein